MRRLPDLVYLQAGVAELQAYLLSNQLYWHLSYPFGRNGKEPLPLTPGNALLAVTRLKMPSLVDEQKSQNERTIREFEEIKQQWLSAWRKKVEHEIKARLRLWQNYIQDYALDPGQYYPDYPREVRNRVILELLTAEITMLDAKTVNHLDQLDAVIRRHLVPGEFLWESELASQFPEAKYWYLYGQLRSNIMED
jgi:hypothetical protein